MMVAPRTCIGCGCTDDHACPNGCSWALESELVTIGICSNCAQVFEDPEGALLAAAQDFVDQDPPDLGEPSGLILPDNPVFYPTLRGMR